MYPHKRDRARQRTTILALFALVAFSCYILFITNPSLSARSRVYGDRGALAYKDFVPMPHSSAPARRPQLIYQPVNAHSPQLTLTPSQELAALSAFLAALPHNRLPSAVNPNQPLDPQLILDFNTGSESAREELDRVVEEMWSRHPVVLFAKVSFGECHLVDPRLTSPNPAALHAFQRTARDADQNEHQTSPPRFRSRPAR